MLNNSQSSLRHFDHYEVLSLAEIIHLADVNLSIYAVSVCI